MNKFIELATNDMQDVYLKFVKIYLANNYNKKGCIDLYQDLSWPVGNLLAVSYKNIEMHMKKICDATIIEDGYYEMIENISKSILDDKIDFLKLQKFKVKK